MGIACQGPQPAESVARRQSAVTLDFGSCSKKRVAVTVGGDHSCALRSDHTVECWGNAVERGNDPNLPDPPFDTPAPVVNLTDASSIAAGSAHTCALIDDGTVKCWGTNFDGQIGNAGAAGTAGTPLTVSNLTGATAIASSASSEHNCALLGDGTVSCWGKGTSGQLGQGMNVGSHVPVPVAGLSQVTALAVGGAHTCALISGGTVKCWGSNFNGQLGSGTVGSPDQLAPTTVPGLGGVTQLLAGDQFTCALLSGGTVTCWGDNTYHELGTTGASRTTTATVGGLSNVVDLFLGGNSACAVTSAGAALCWGDDGAGQLGNATPQPDFITPTAIANLVDVSSVAVSVTHGCAVKTDGTAWCWGSGGSGTLGAGPSVFNSGVPVQVLSNGAFTAAATLCRRSVGPCDAPEACTGTTPDCPADTFAPAGSTCRLGPDVCDPTEVCDGMSGLCPPDVVLPFCAVVPVGTNVQVDVDGPVGIGTHFRYRFGTVTAGGSFTVSGGSVVPPNVAPAFILNWGSQPLSYWQFHTTAVTAAPFDVCITYDAAAVPGDPQLLALELAVPASGQPTVATSVDTINHLACATTNLQPLTGAAGSAGSAGAAGSTGSAGTSGAAIGAPCTTVADCVPGAFCTDGSCCDSACGDSDDGDCQVCSAAKGASASGTCTLLGSTHMCRAGSGNVCDLGGFCAGGPDCPTTNTPASTTTCYTRPSGDQCASQEATLTCGSGLMCPAPTAWQPGGCGAQDSTSLEVTLHDDAVPPGTVTVQFTDVYNGTISVTRATGCPSATGFTFPPSRDPTVDPASIYWDLNAEPPLDCSMGNVEVCVTYPQEWFGPSEDPMEQYLQLRHGTSSAQINSTTCDPTAAAWAYLPQSRPVDTVNNVVCANTCSLSPFALMIPASLAQIPTVQPHAPIVAEATSAMGAVVTYTASATDLKDGMLLPNCLPASGNVFPIGTTNVTCTATNSDHLKGTGTFTVIVADTKGPVFTNVPASPIVAFATSTAGAKVTYAPPTAMDAVDGKAAVKCLPAAGSTFAPGKTTVTCNASDKHGHAAPPATFTVWVQYQAPADGTFFLLPIRPNGSSIFRIGRPVPVRFKLNGASACITNLQAKLVVTKISSTIQGSILDASDETVDDTDLLFKYRALFKWYAYRWKTSNQTQGTYRLEAVLGDGVTHQINVSLKAAK
jgi:alpha-tubulin suppressor-like RCC1 family protein